LTLTFNEPVQVVPGGTTVLAADGTPVDVDVAAVDDALVVTPGTTLGDGTYVVSWRVVSLDTHPVAGAFTFSVGAPSTTAVEARVAEPTAALVAVRALDQAAVYAGTFLVAGLVVFELLVLHVSPGAAPVLRRRLHRVRRGALGVAAVGTVLAVPLTPAWQAGGGLGALADPATWAAGLASDTTVAGALGLAGLVVATLLAPRAARETRAAWPAGTVLGAAALALGSLVLVGHTRTFGPPWLVVPPTPSAQDAATSGVEVVEELGDGTLRARVTPGRVGVNALEIELLDADGAPFEPVAVPELATTLADPALGPFSRPLTRTGPGAYEATLDLPMPGSWTLEVSVRTSKYENPIVHIPVEVTS
ncbi:MAG: FixH family protein, partial [Cellulosimicrobium funkei]